MFTGIIRQSCSVTRVTEKDNFKRISVDLDQAIGAGIDIGASVSVNGTCLTVATIDESVVTFDVMGETLNKTTLGTLNSGDRVNIERAAKQGDEIGGHPLSGHIDGLVEIISIETPSNNYVLSLKVLNDDLLPYIFNKGYVALDGASLTVVDWDREAGTFCVHLIPETLDRTIIADKVVGDKINIEIDRTTQAIVDTVTHVLETMKLNNQ